MWYFIISWKLHSENPQLPAPPLKSPLTPIKVQELQVPLFLLILCNNKMFHGQMAQKTSLSAFRDPGMSADFY